MGSGWDTRDSWASSLGNGGWGADDTWGRYAPDVFHAPPPPPEPRRSRRAEAISRAFSEPEIVELKPRRWWWPWTWSKKSLPTAKVVKR